ncbi:MAG: AraC family transcriptional regulator [Bryobacterales bacterium]|nr:AraC family transcriptional regulator [Bryobacterales bacterium]
MPNVYREYSPPSHLATSVECFWTSCAATDGPHRVYPDGCMDLMYTRENGRSRLEVIGAMTQFVDAEAAAGTEIFAVRFRPGGMGLPLGADELRDAAVEWQAIHPHDARLLKSRLDDASGTQQMMEICSRILPPAGCDPVQRAVAEIERQHGVTDLEWLARQANVSERQFRRLCAASTGLAPKQMARVLRFRHALRLLRDAKRGDLAGLALDCGYYDQSHFIREFRLLAGESPVRFLQSSPRAERLHSGHEDHSSSHHGAD